MINIDGTKTLTVSSDSKVPFLLHLIHTGYTHTHVVRRGIIGPGGWIRLW